MAKQAKKEITKLTEEELKQLAQFRTNSEILLREFGQISLLELQLEKRREVAENNVAKNEENQVAFSKTLQEKYGVGNINLDTGEFTPIE